MIARVTRRAVAARAQVVRSSPVALGWALLGLGILIHLPSLGQPLVEHESARQTVTAFPALIYHEQGIDLLRPEVPVFGPPFVLPLEFPLFQAMASLVMDLGIAPDVATRATALACFALTAFLLWRLIARIADERAALAAVAAFVYSPLGLLLSRMALIEYLATAAGVALVLASLRWHEDGRRRWFAIGLVAATIGTLVKVTTMVMYFPPAVVLIASAMWSRRPVGRWPAYLAMSAVLVALPALLGVGWLLYADRVRAANPSTAWLSTSGGLSGYYFGSLQDRLDPSTWWLLLQDAGTLLFGGYLWLWVLLSLAAAATLARRAFALTLLASAGLGPLLFTIQYADLGHGYYMAALSPLVAAGVGLGAGWVWRQRQSRIVGVVMVSLALSWVLTLYLTVGYWGRQFVPVYDLDQTLAAAEFLAAHTQPGELVALSGQDWNPTVFYYAGRRGTMIREQTGPSLPELRAAGYQRIFFCPPHRGPPNACDIIDIGDQ